MRNPHEDRFVSRYLVAFFNAEITQEMTIPRKARHIDLVHLRGSDLSALGVLAPWIQDRALLWEHQSNAVTHRVLAKATMALSWAAIQYHTRESADMNPIREGFQSHARAPAMVVYAPRIAITCRHLFQELATGFWHNGLSDDPQVPLLLCIEYERLLDAPGTSFLRWLAPQSGTPLPRRRKPRSPLDALLDDPTFPTMIKRRILEGIMQEQLKVDPMEQLSAIERVREEGRREVREKARKELQRVQRLAKRTEERALQTEQRAQQTAQRAQQTEQRALRALAELESLVAQGTLQPDALSKLRAMLVADVVPDGE